MVERDTLQHHVPEAEGTEVQEGGGIQSETQAMKSRIGTYKESPKMGKPWLLVPLSEQSHCRGGSRNPPAVR